MDQIINDILCNVKEYLKKLDDDEKFYASKDHTHVKVNITDFEHGNESHSETYAKKDYVDSELGTKVGKNEQIAINKIINLRNELDARVTTSTFNAQKTALQNSINTLQDNINTKSTVTYTPTQTNGDAIGTLTIDNVEEILYSKPYNSTNDIQDPNKHTNIGSSTKATQSSINSLIDTKILDLKHPTTHLTDIIQDPNAHTNIGSSAKATQSSINSLIDNELSRKINAINGKGLSSNDYTNIDKEKVNAMSSYFIYLTAANTQGEPPAIGSILSVAKNKDGIGKIYACVKKNKNTIQTEGDVVFIVNGVTYVRGIGETNGEYAATLNIKLDSKNAAGDIDPKTVIAIYRTPDKWSAAVDIRQMLVFENIYERIEYENNNPNMIFDDNFDSNFI